MDDWFVDVGFKEPVELRGPNGESRAMTSPIQPLAPGERPTEPGWYVVRNSFCSRQVVQIAIHGRVLFSGSEFAFGVEEVLDQGFTFIARILPDRIGQE